MYTAISGVKHQGGGTALTTAEEILAEDPRRGGVSITNKSDVDYLYVCFGTDKDAISGIGIAIPPNEIEFFQDCHARVTVVSEAGNVPYSYAAVV